MQIALIFVFLSSNINLSSIEMDFRVVLLLSTDILAKPSFTLSLGLLVKYCCERVLCSIDFLLILISICCFKLLFSGESCSKN